MPTRPGRRPVMIMAGAVLMAFAATQAQAQTYNWSGLDNDLWSVGPWITTVPGAGNVAVFSELGAGATVDLGATDITVAGLTFNTNVAGGNTIAAISAPATKLILQTGATVNVDGTHTISAPLQLTNGTSDFSVAAAGKLTLSGVVTTSGANPSFTEIQKDGPGDLIITSPVYPGYIAGDPDALIRRRVFVNEGMVEIRPGANVNVTRWLTQTTNGYVRQTGGTLSVDGWEDGGELNLGWGNGYASYELKAGTINILPGSWIQVANAGAGGDPRGIMTIGDGTSTPAVNLTYATFELGDNGGTGSGTVVHRSGTVFNDGVGADGFWGHLDIGVGNTGIYNQLGGTVTDTDGVAIQLSPSATGIYNLNGGQLITSRVYGSGTLDGDGPTPNAFFNFNGGTLKALGNSADFLNERNPLNNPIGVTTTVYQNGGTIDTAGFNLTINKNILGPAGQGLAPITFTLGTGGAGYRGAPVLEVVRDAAWPDTTGTGATAVANMVDDGSGNGTYSIGSITVTCPGQNYDGTPTLDFVGGDPTTPATVDPLTLANNIGGTLTKTGAGTLTLTGTDTLGSVVVNAGALDLPGSAKVTCTRNPGNNNYYNNNGGLAVNNSLVTLRGNSIVEVGQGSVPVYGASGNLVMSENANLNMQGVFANNFTGTGFLTVAGSANPTVLMRDNAYIGTYSDPERTVKAPSKVTWWDICFDQGGGTFNMRDSASVNIDYANGQPGISRYEGRIRIGQQGTGILNITDNASIHCANMGFAENGGLGILNQSGNAEVHVDTQTALPRHSDGIGASNFSGQNRYNISGGKLWTTTRYSVADGELNITGTGLVDLSDSMDDLSVKMTYGLGPDGARPVVNLKRGTLFVKTVDGGNKASTATMNFDFNGGTLKAAMSGVTILGNNSATLNAVVYPGGAVVDSAGQDVTISQNLLAAADTGVLTIPVATGGSGYYFAPNVQVTGGTLSVGPAGKNLAPVAAIVHLSAGAVSSVEIINPGSYTDVSTLTLSLIGGDGAGASLDPYTTGTNTSGGLTKKSAGTLTLSGANTYTGDTVVQAGTLSITTAYLADGADVKLYTGGILDLNTSGAMDTIRSLYINGVPQAAGVWGALGSGVANESAFITGSGFLDVSTLGVASGYASWAATNAGGQPANQDFNNDGVANGVAYFMNKAGLTTNPGINGTTKQVTWPNGGNIPSTDYDTQFVVQTSSDLQSWADVPAGDANLINIPASVSYTQSGASPRFVRLKVTPN
ncbi:MAG: autotransporter-associated beta strand repeat-containing protein [Verrucomicrobia bacterium]|nr:autotransporter-associated beta strand repeat-containing protein [Verrucomicrobiota bacterium]